MCLASLVEKLPNLLGEFPRSFASHDEGPFRSCDMRIREDRDDFAVPVYNLGAVLESGDGQRAHQSRAGAITGWLQVIH